MYCCFPCLIPLFNPHISCPIMGKPSRQRRNRLRMTKYNLSKSNQLIQIKQNDITNLLEEISRLEKDQHQQKIDSQLNNYFLDNIIKNLQEEILQLTDEISQFPVKLAAALESQKDAHSKKHKTILQTYSNNLKEQYSKELEENVSSYKSYINALEEELRIANRIILSANDKKPPFSQKIGDIT